MVEAAFVTPVAAIQSVHNIDTGLSYDTIQEAIDANETLGGHTIRVDAGIYYERLFVNKSLTIIGEDSNTTIVDGNGTGNIVLINKPNVEILGFTVQNSGQDMESGVIINRRASNSTVRQCLIRNNYYGITLIDSNGSGVIGNVLTNNSVWGLQIKDSSYNTFRENTITSNPTGVMITSSLSISINNTFYHNNFIDNPIQVSPFGLNIWDNGTEGNYWSDYTGEDSNGDGIGDTPYEIDSINQDRYPFMGSWGWETESPSISNVSHEPEIPDNGENVTVTAEVIDEESGVQTAILSYSTNDGETWNNVTMGKTVGATYEGKIPGWPAGTHVQYKIIAYDNARNPAVEDNAGEYHTYTVVPEFPAAAFLLLFIILTLVVLRFGNKRRSN